jgi:hypothetical protein
MERRRHRDEAAATAAGARRAAVCMRANSTTCRPTVWSWNRTLSSTQAPSGPNTARAELMPTPSGVGQPRSECTIERSATSVVPVACQP